METKRPGGLKGVEDRMQSNQIGVGIVGYGYWGPNLVRNFANNPSARVVGVSDLDSAKFAAIKRAYPGATTTDRYEDLLKDASIDAIAIATPVHTHYELALSALRAGKHVLVEKPLAQSADLVRRLIDEADRRGLTLMVDHTFLYTPAVQKIRELMARGELGEVYYYDSTRSSLGLFQNDVNVIWDLAVHDISIIQYILDEDPVAISATGSCHVAGSPENMAHITLFFESKCVAHVSVNWLSPIKVRQSFVGGSKKMIVYDDLEPTEKIKVYDKGITLNALSEDAHEFRIGYRAGDMWAPHISTKEALQTEVEHFIDCVRTGAPPVSSGISGLRVVEVLEAASRSIADKGKPVLLKQRRRIPEGTQRPWPELVADAHPLDPLKVATGLR
jgi:predicted dehydrogenase